MTNCVHECTTTITSTRVLPGSSTSVHTGRYTTHYFITVYPGPKEITFFYLHVPVHLLDTVQFN
jgi:hypothetical protein